MAQNLMQSRYIGERERGERERGRERERERSTYDVYTVLCVII